jgi:hypothetical protein
MKSLLIPILTICLLFLTSCRRDASVEVSTEMDISYKDITGKDLLNPSTQNYYSSDNIRVFSLSNGVKKEFYNPMMDYPNDFLIYNNDSLNLFFIRVFLESDTVLLQLNQSTTDTLISITDRSHGNEILRKFWYNGILKWEFGTAQVITVLK